MAAGRTSSVLAWALQALRRGAPPPRPGRQPLGGPTIAAPPPPFHRHRHLLQVLSASGAQERGKTDTGRQPLTPRHVDDPHADLAVAQEVVPHHAAVLRVLVARQHHQVCSCRQPRHVGWPHPPLRYARLCCLQAGWGEITCGELGR